LVGEAKVKANFKSWGGTTALYVAVECRDFEMVNWLVEGGGAIGTAQDEQGRDLKIVKYLVGEGVEANLRARGGRTTLHVAAQWGDFEAVRWLIEEGGAIVTAQDEYGLTVLHYAAEYGHLEMVRWLVEAKGLEAAARGKHGITALHLAVFSDNVEVLEYLIHEGKLSVNVKDEDGETPLHYTAKPGASALARQWLLEEGNADVSV
jgi:ankyrin repeat protein